MKRLAAVGMLGALLGSLATSARAELKWLTDYEEGQKAAAESGKTLLVDFTGSDWCHWCIQLKEEVFSQEAFAAAAEKYVLVELDFPQDQEAITPEQRGKNEALAEKLGVQGFPSVLLFDKQGRAYARTGYQAGGPDAYLKHLEEIDQPYRSLQAAEDDARKEALVVFLRTLAGEDIVDNFAKEFEELKTLDPDDETGFVAELETAKAMADFEDGVDEKLTAGDFEGVLAQVDSFLAEHDPQGEIRQSVLMGRVMVYVEQGEKEKAFSEIEGMVKFAPESQFSQNVEEVKKSIQEHMEMRAEMEREAAEHPEEPGEGEEPEAVEEEKPATTNPAPAVE